MQFFFFFCISSIITWIPPNFIFLISYDTYLRIDSHVLVEQAYATAVVQIHVSGVFLGSLLSQGGLSRVIFCCAYCGTGQVRSGNGSLFSSQGLRWLHCWDYLPLDRQSWYKYPEQQCWANRVMKTFQEACVRKAGIDLDLQAFWQTTHTLSHTTLCHHCYTIPKTSAVWLVCSLLFVELNVMPHQWQKCLSGIPYIPFTTCFYGEIRHMYPTRINSQPTYGIAHVFECEPAPEVPQELTC